MIIFLLAWHLSSAIHRYVQTYAPTNIAIAWLRARRSLRWAIPAAVVATPLYAWASTALGDVIEHGGPAWLGFVAMLCVWNALKFAINAVLTPFFIVRRRNPRTSGPGGSDRTNCQDVDGRNRLGVPLQSITSSSRARVDAT